MNSIGAATAFVNKPSCLLDHELEPEQSTRHRLSVIGDPDRLCLNKTLPIPTVGRPRTRADTIFISSSPIAARLSDPVPARTFWDKTNFFQNPFASTSTTYNPTSGTPVPESQRSNRGNQAATIAKQIVTKSEYRQFADELAKEAGVENGCHKYFLSHQERLWATASHFDLWNLRGRDILELGPFFSYTPFVLARQGNRVHVLEGTTPAVDPLKALYTSRGIEMTLCDLRESFGGADASRRCFPFSDSQFDVVSCWETMEHFNFNPVGFVKDLRRILKRGGALFITVPNVARMDQRLKLLFGKGIGASIESYYQFYDHPDGRYLGFHWREYTLDELNELFQKAGFRINSAKYLLTFQSYSTLSIGRRGKRLLARMFFRLFPSVGSTCALVATRE